MYPFLLQDWVTLRGPSSGSITQSELTWLDTSEFLDLVTWLQVSDLEGGTFYCAFQTAPTKDDSLFMPMNDVTVSTGTPVAQGVQVGVYLRDTSICPLSHWLRWQIVPPASAGWSITFRIWVSANQPGGLASDIAAGETSRYAGGPAWTEGGGVPASGAGPSLMSKVGGSHPQNAPAAHMQKFDRFGRSYGIVEATRPHPVSPTAPRPTHARMRPHGPAIAAPFRPPLPGAVNPYVPPGKKQE